MAEAPVPDDTPRARSGEADLAPTDGAIDLPARLHGLYGRARTEALASITTVRLARLDPPPHDARLQRFGYGLALPAALARIILADEALRRRYLQVVGVQFAVIFAVGLVVLRTSYWTVPLTFADQAAFWSSLYAILCVVEWVVFALSRDYHAALARDLCLLAGIPPEDAELTPAIRLDVRWVWRKLKARTRGALVFASVIPLASLFSQVGLPGRAAAAVLVAAWSVYWAGVFVTAKTAHGWTNEATAPQPFYLRTWNQASRPLPWVIRWIPATYGKIWAWLTHSLFAPASRFEASPYELTGLALARVVRYVPGVYLLFKPLFGVSAAHILLLQEQRQQAAASAPADAEKANPPPAG
jgi:hypothetical protein